MKNFLLKENKLFAIMAYGIVFLYILSVSYFILWQSKPTYYFYIFNLTTLIYCIMGIITERDIKIKPLKEPKHKEFKIINTIFINKIFISLYVILLGIIIIFDRETLSHFYYIPILIFTLTILKSIFNLKNKNIEINYNENFIYFDKEKILFEDIKEYSVETENIISKCTIYLENNSEIIYYELMNQNNFKSSLIKNLQYLKIPERYLD